MLPRLRNLSLRRLARFALRLVVPSMRQVRLAAYALVVFGALALIAARSVYADVREVGLGVGHQLAALEDLTGGAYVVHINGAEVRWASARTDQSVMAVLDRYEEHCRRSPSSLGAALEDIPRALEDRVPGPKSDPARAGIFRDADEGRGMVACFVREGASGDIEEVRAALEALARTGDLASLGRFRYVFAERSPRGDTRVVTLWAEGSLDLGRMFPAEGDAPGTDSRLVPRPAGSRRTLSASIAGFPAAVRIYESDAAPAELVANAGRALRAAGFEPASSPGAGGESARAAWVRRDGAEVILTASSRERRSVLSVVEASGRAVSAIKVEKEGGESP
ncbi:MAG: hypothetical protein KF764_07555 [Labilithrix sp.]|nr:hypothetical protein [Labilithrix sp.]